MTQKVSRPGKTAKDRANGAFARNATNKRLRADWSNDKNASAGNFPKETCNGKRNRYLK